MTTSHKNHAAQVAGRNGFSLISNETFRELYAALLQCVLLDRHLSQASNYELWTGREAATAGISACLRSDDTITPNSRSRLANYLHRKNLLSLSDGAAIDSPLAAATGDGLRHKLTAKGNVAVVFSPLGDPEAAVRIFAASMKHLLPVFYVLDNNPALHKAAGSIPVMRVDDADTVAVYRVAHESIARAREGGGPTIMECAPWHGDALHDPLEKFENYLTGKKLFRRDWKARLERKYNEEIKEATSHAELNGI